MGKTKFYLFWELNQRPPVQCPVRYSLSYCSRKYRVRRIISLIERSYAVTFIFEFSISKYYVHSTLTGGFSGCVHIGGQDSSAGKSLYLQSKDCRFESHCQRGVFLTWAFSKHSHSKLLVWVRKVPTSGLGSKSLHEMYKIHLHLSLFKFRRVKCKQMA